MKPRINRTGADGNTVKKAPLYDRIRQILESARTAVVRSVNTTQVVANWLIGREIVEEEQSGHARAGYGKRQLEELAAELARDFGGGYSVQNLRFIRQFYITYPLLIPKSEIRYALRSESVSPLSVKSSDIRHAVRGELADALISDAVLRQLPPDGKDISSASHKEFWKPGQLHPNLSWTHYRTLLRAGKAEARAFYEIEAIRNNWSARELERQIYSLLYERLALSRDKKGLMRLATKGHEVQKPVDVFKDPVVMEFLGMPESPKLVETALETALINNLQAFLLYDSA